MWDDIKRTNAGMLLAVQTVKRKRYYAHDTPFLAGAATRIITPPIGERPVFLAGFEGDRRATAVHSDLYARALALRLGDQVAILVACDLIGLGAADVEDIRAVLAARDIDAEGLVVACTHTHSGPDTIGLWGPDQTISGVDPVYMAAVKRRSPRPPSRR